MKRLLACMICTTLLAGCATGAQFDAMTVPASEDRIIEATSVLHHAIEVAHVSGGKETHPLWKSNVSTEAFENALKESLNVHTLLATQDGVYKLDAEMIEIEQPFVGLDITVTAKIHYILSDAGTGAVIFEHLIQTPHTATFSDAFYAVKRLRLANEGAIKKNIHELIQFLIEQAASNPSLSPRTTEELISQLSPFSTNS